MTDLGPPGLTLVLDGTWTLDATADGVHIVQAGILDLVPDTGAVIVNNGTLRVGGLLDVELDRSGDNTPWWTLAVILGGLSFRILERLREMADDQ